MIGADGVGSDLVASGNDPFGFDDPQFTMWDFWIAPTPKAAIPPSASTFDTIYGESGELDFKGRSVRYLKVNGSPWFALGDLQEAVGFGREALEVVNRRDFPSFAKHIAMEAFDAEVPGEPGDVIILSPVGVWYWSHLYEPGVGQEIASWAKRAAAAIHPDPAPYDPHMFLRVLEVDGKPKLPPYPLKFSGRKAEWCAIRESDEWVYRDFPSQREREGVPPLMPA